MGNLFHAIPEKLENECFEDLLKCEAIRIERIVSRGHQSPEKGWFDQTENEWVLVLEGSGRIEYEDGSAVLLEKGDHLNIPKHTKHRVAWTDPDRATVWLAVFY
jgi:cupin 2 domain-containing protein